MRCGVGHRRGLDLARLWLWHRLVAVAPIRLLAWEPPHATGWCCSKKTNRQKKKKKKKKESQEPERVCFRNESGQLCPVLLSSARCPLDWQSGEGVCVSCPISGTYDDFALPATSNSSPSAISSMSSRIYSSPIFKKIFFITVDLQCFVNFCCTAK